MGRNYETIEDFKKSSIELSQEMIGLSRRIEILTWVIAGLTVALIILTIWQFF